MEFIGGSLDVKKKKKKLHFIGGFATFLRGIDRNGTADTTTGREHGFCYQAHKTWRLTFHPEWFHTSRNIIGGN